MRPATRCCPGTERAHSWFTFQLAFILMQLPLLTDPAAAKRSGDLATAQLLFFPTGGGKTEAYLGLAAFAFAIRRRQGVVDTAGRAARRPGRGDGADALHAAAADRAAVPARRRAGLRRRAGPPRTTRPHGATEPFRIGLWVGTDVSAPSTSTRPRSSSSGGQLRAAATG